MPKPPWNLKLFEYLTRGFGGDSSFDTFNRRYLWQGMYLPCDTKQVMGEIAVAVDTSGSMSSEQLSLAFGYIRAFREQHPCKLHLIQCDYDSVGEGQYKLYDDWEPLPATFKAVGRGGTSFDPPFKLLHEKRIDPKVLIYLTDGYGHCSLKNPGYPVLWVILKGDADWKQPFGDKVVVK
jgi:predicted metal-dependent peptidase